ncbi:MAG: glycosyltransferase family 2 protein [Acidobacteria bacterium]|nr:glycosyltransferase family 2 protein [Acidobacteriota bacterium]
MGTKGGPRLDLVVVMPVYNEEACISGVIDAWLDVLDRLGARTQLRVINDGSTDGTRAALDACQTDARVCVVHKSNSGHGQTILSGYRAALSAADWVFQVDSDGELGAGDLETFWRARERWDGVFGIRVNRAQSAGRAVVSSVSRAIVRVCFGATVADVNVPYRLMRTSVLADFLDRIPSTSFAPNVMISGEYARRKLRVLNLPVVHQPRQTGTSSIASWRLYRKAARAAIETLRYRFTQDAASPTGKDPRR